MKLTRTRVKAARKVRIGAGLPAPVHVPNDAKLFINCIGPDGEPCPVLYCDKCPKAR
jgi:hypothetical protein